MAKHALQQDHAGSLLAAAEHMTAKDVVDAARAGDALSLRIVEERGGL